MNKNPKNMKKISVLFLLLLSAAVGRASELSLRVNLSDGRTETYSLDEHPHIHDRRATHRIGETSPADDDRKTRPRGGACHYVA